MSDFYGPALPPSFTASQSEETDKDDTTKNQGPQQPTSLRAESPHRKNASASSTVYGPALPPVSGSAGTDHDTATHTRGPGLPGNDEILENETQHEKEGKLVEVQVCVLDTRRAMTLSWVHFCVAHSCHHL